MHSQQIDHARARRSRGHGVPALGRLEQSREADAADGEEAGHQHVGVAPDDALVRRGGGGDRERHEREPRPLPRPLTAPLQ